MIKKVILLFLILTGSARAITFNEAVDILQKHESIETIVGKSKSIAEEAASKGSWSDPIFKIAAKNFPKDSLAQDQTPMAGIEFSVSQKIPLTTKYRNIEGAFSSLSRAYRYEANDKREALTKSLWELLILKRKITEELKILNENDTWISKTLRVSKKLYANGKISQPDILDIQIRRSEIKIKISNKSFELSQINDKFNYLIGRTDIEDRSIPWSVLKKSSMNSVDNRALSLKEKLNATKFGLIASKLNYVPDLTFSLGITKRSNIDNNGDLVAASVGLPLPFFGEKYSNHGKAVQEKYIAAKNYESYKKSKSKDVAILEKEIQKLINEISILKNKTIKFAMNSRLITAKSYGLGNSSYVDLLQRELTLQKILLHKTMLEAQRDIKRTTLKYVLGESLNE